MLVYRYSVYLNAISCVQPNVPKYHNKLNCPTFIEFDNNGCITYCVFCNNGRLHRTNGPAILDFSNTEQKYYLNGLIYSKIDYFLEILKNV